MANEAIHLANPFYEDAGKLSFFLCVWNKCFGEFENNIQIYKTIDCLLSYKSREVYSQPFIGQWGRRDWEKKKKTA